MLEGKYNGKYFSVLGDSVSTFEGFTEPDYAVFYTFGQKIASGVLSYPDTWWGRVINAFGGKLLVNNSFSGVRLPGARPMKFSPMLAATSARVLLIKAVFCPALSWCLWV